VYNYKYNNRETPNYLGTRVQCSCPQRYYESSTPQLLNNGNNWLHLRVLKGKMLERAHHHQAYHQSLFTRGNVVTKAWGGCRSKVDRASGHMLF
jgi:hypothetical protein